MPHASRLRRALLCAALGASSVGLATTTAASAEEPPRTTPGADVTPPSTPTGGRNTFDGSGFTVLWNPSTDESGGSGLDHYEVIVVRGWAEVTSFAPATETSVSGLPYEACNGSPFFADVVAVDRAGNRSARHEVRLNIPIADCEGSPDARPPRLPRPVEGIRTTDRTTTELTWQPATDDRGVDRYEILDGRVVVATTQATQATLTGLDPARTYTYTVRAVDGAGNRSFEVDVTPTPAAVAFVDRTIGLTCTTERDEGVVGISARIRGEVPRTTSPGQAVALTNARVNIVSGLSPAGPIGDDRLMLFGHIYGLTFAFGGGAPAEYVAPVPDGYPLPRVFATENSPLRWDTAVPAVGTPATTAGKDDVTIDLGRLSFGAQVHFPDANVALRLPAEQTCTPTPGQAPIATVEAAADTLAPSIPSGLNAVRSGDGSTATLTWSPSTDDVGVVSYEIVSGDQVVGTSPTPSFTASGLDGRSPYTFAVRAKDAAGNTSASSTAITVQPPVIPCACDPYDYDIVGSAAIRTLVKGNVPIKGRSTFSVVLNTGAISADLAFNPTKARLVALGFLPVTAQVAFVTSGKTTGRIDEAGLTAKALARIKLPEIKLFGTIPLAGGSTCQTRALSTIALVGPGFDLLDGGVVTGTFAISDLSGCGALNGLVSPLTAGGGNTMRIALTPAP